MNPQKFLGKPKNSKESLRTSRNLKEYLGIFIQESIELLEYVIPTPAPPLPTPCYDVSPCYSILCLYDLPRFLLVPGSGILLELLHNKTYFINKFQFYNQRTTCLFKKKIF